MKFIKKLRLTKIKNKKLQYLDYFLINSQTLFLQVLTAFSE